MVLLHRAVRFIHVRNVRILGWPTRRQHAVWWLYELREIEAWRNYAAKLTALNQAVRHWLQLQA